LIFGGAVETSLGAVLELDIVKVNDALAEARGWASFAVSVIVKEPISLVEVEAITSVSTPDQEINPLEIVPELPPPLYKYVPDRVIGPPSKSDM
jgi:hypothetical protein